MNPCRCRAFLATRVAVNVLGKESCELGTKPVLLFSSHKTPLNTQALINRLFPRLDSKYPQPIRLIGEVANPTEKPMVVFFQAQDALMQIPAMLCWVNPRWHYKSDGSSGRLPRQLKRVDYDALLMTSVKQEVSLE